MTSLPIRALAAVLLCTAAAQAVVIADLDLDYIHQRDSEGNVLDPLPGFPVGWTYQWNPTGVDIGDSANYADLVFGSEVFGNNNWFPDVIDPSDDLTNASGGNFDSQNSNSLRLQEGIENDPNPNRIGARWIISGRDAATSTDGLDHFAIVGYTIQEGEVDPGGSSLSVTTDGDVGNANTGHEFRVYLNDTLVDTSVGTVGGNETADVNATIESANVGDTVYVAYLSDINDGDGAPLNRNARRWFSAVTISTVVLIPGDFNEDGVVDAADYTVWRDNLGSDTALPNDNDLGTPVGVEQYELWRTNFGQGSGDASAAAVPEPAAWLLLAAAPLARPRRTAKRRR